MEPYILVFDVGTSSLKAVVYNREGRVVAKKSRFYEFSSPCDGWAEIDAEIWWESLVAVSKQLRAENVDFSSISGIALTGQMHSAVLLDENDKPVGPVILWLDRRAAEETAELQERFGLPPYKLNSSYTLPKLYWLAKHESEQLQKVRTILWPKDYLRFRLTGVKVTDYTEGIGSSLINWENRQWAVERIEACGLSSDVLPPIVPQERMYPIQDTIASELGIRFDCQVLVGCGDIAALLGGAPHRPGRLVYSLGSSSMYFTEIRGEPMEREGLYSLQLGTYTLFGGVSSTTGAALNWAYEILWGGEKVIPFQKMVDEALDEHIRTETLLFFPFLAGERSPFWSDAIAASFEGLRLHHTKAHLSRAVMEGVAFSIRYILDLMKASGLSIDELALAGGGAKTKGWPELIAAVTDIPVAIYNAEETVTTVLYALMDAALTGKDFKQVLDAQFSESRPVAADPVLIARYRPMYRRYVAFLREKARLYGC